MPGTALDRRVGTVTGSAAGIRRGTMIAATDSRETMPPGRTGTADEVACGVPRLCSAAASYATGVIVATDGGQAPG